MNKEELRREAKLRRLAMPAAQVSAKSQLIVQKLIEEIDWQKIRHVHVYEPVKSLREVNTEPLIDFLRRRPAIGLTLQPKSAKLPAASAKYDLIIVPTLAFDGRGYRLGWGGGWYDRFLASQPQALKIGLCFEVGRLPRVPMEAHDIALDKIITEEGIIAKS